MRKEKNLWMARIAIIAALYVVLTFVSYPFSYGVIQFRISEALMVLCFYDRKYVWALTIGCVVTNFFSFSLVDCIVGTLATLIAGLTMLFIKKKWLSLFAPVVFNGIIVGLELYFYYKSPLLISMGSVALGELVVMFFLGSILFYYIENNKTLMEVIGIKKVIKIVDKQVNDMI